MLLGGAEGFDRGDGHGKNFFDFSHERAQFTVWKQISLDQELKPIERFVGLLFHYLQLVKHVGARFGAFRRAIVRADRRATPQQLPANYSACFSLWQRFY